MSDIPDSIKAKAKADNVSFLDLWLTATATIRDAVLARAEAEAEDGVCLEWAYEEVAKTYPWIPEGEERNAVAFTALTYGCGIRLWGFKVVDEDGNELSGKEAREIVTTPDDPRMKTTFIQWPLLPAEERKR